MTRSKVKLKLIENETLRRTTYNKREEGLRKKMEEISKLCDVKGCMILYNAEFEGEYVWPSMAEANELLVKFESLPTNIQTKKMVNHDEYMKSRIAKLRDEIAKQEIKNKKIEASILIHKISNGGMAEIKEPREAALLAWFAEEKLQEIQRHKQLFPSPEPPPPPASAPQLPMGLPVWPPHVGHESPMDPNLASTLSAYAKNIHRGDGASSSGTKDA